MLFRNDDVSSDTDVKELKRFCELFDKYGFKLVHGVTLFGPLIPINSSWSNFELDTKCPDSVFANKPVLEYLKSRKDEIAVHGWRHWHHLGGDKNMLETINSSRDVLIAYFERGVKYFIPPFNEYDDAVKSYCDSIGLEILSTEGGHIEIEMERKPSLNATSVLMYADHWRCHSWRFHKVYERGYEKLDAFLNVVYETNRRRDEY